MLLLLSAISHCVWFSRQDLLLLHLLLDILFIWLYFISLVFVLGQNNCMQLSMSSHFLFHSVFSTSGYQMISKYERCVYFHDSQKDHLAETLSSLATDFSELWLGWWCLIKLCCIFPLVYLSHRAIPVAPQTAPPPRMVNLCQATQTTILAPNPMLQGALLMQQMQGTVLIIVKRQQHLEIMKSSRICIWHVHR